MWEREQDLLYGNSRQGFAKENFRCPFKYQGQYYDPEIELCYNRFRYYHPETGRYISEDPIRLAGGLAFYRYVMDCNGGVDVFGLNEMPKGGWNYHNMPKIEDYQLHHVIPKSMYKSCWF
ncbi:RHS repeat-associated core domain-containing protein [uncultured Capnocytophaga sp.]|uniref:RHS repeat domain-containing protein n=1 Tax=uncultured Capnocytophaga sp. TaxID=159273 RepID=UPI00260AC72A|nr:RHS repeat-associated core domain-containing protein [uncultured Capnocytophaga sp.]